MRSHTLLPRTVGKDSRLRRVSPLASRLWLSLWHAVSDGGAIEADAIQLLDALDGYGPQVDADRVADAGKELEKAGLLRRFRTKDKRVWYWHPDFFAANANQYKPAPGNDSAPLAPWLEAQRTKDGHYRYALVEKPARAKDSKARSRGTTGSQSGDDRGTTGARPGPDRTPTGSQSGQLYPDAPAQSDTHAPAQSDAHGTPGARAPAHEGPGMSSIDDQLGQETPDPYIDGEVAGMLARLRSAQDNRQRSVHVDGPQRLGQVFASGARPPPHGAAPDPPRE